MSSATLEAVPQIRFHPSLHTPPRRPNTDHMHRNQMVGWLWRNTDGRREDFGVLTESELLTLINQLYAD